MKLIYSLIFVSSTLLASAQNDLPTGQIEVVKDFEVHLLETKKIKIVPAPVSIDSTVRRYEYKLLAPSPAIDYVVPELKPLAINPETKPAYYPLFAKAGYGSPNSLLAMVSYDHLQSDYFDWGIDFRHLSADNKKIPLQQFSDSRGRVNGSYLLTEDMQINGYIDGHFEKVYFYGAELIPSNEDALKRAFTRYDLNFNLSNATSDAPAFHYLALFNYLFDKDDLGARERGLRIGGELMTKISASEFPLGISVIADLSKLQHNSEKSLNNLLVNPYFYFHTGDLRLRLGTTFLLKEEQNRILPEIEASYNLFEDMVTFRVGWDGDVFKNNFHSLSSYNPYIHTRLDSIGNMITNKVFIGVKAAKGSVSFEVTGEYTSFNDMSFFLQDLDLTHQFSAVYDDGSYFGLSGSLQFGVLKNVTIRSNAFTRFYSLDNEEKPWHRPTLGIDAQASYTGGGDIYHVSFIFHGENGLPYRTVGGTETRLDPLLDLNLHGDYYFTPAIGAFLEMNNILGNNRERWADYPTYGFNVKAGVMLRL